MNIYIYVGSFILTYLNPVLSQSEICPDPSQEPFVDRVSVPIFELKSTPTPVTICDVFADSKCTKDLKPRNVTGSKINCREQNRREELIEKEVMNECLPVQELVQFDEQRISCKNEKRKVEESKLEVSCKEVPDKLCSEEIKEKCEDSTKKVCAVNRVADCEVVYNLRGEPQMKCSMKDENICKDLPIKSCKYDTEETCRKVTRRECTVLPKKTSREVSERLCSVVSQPIFPPKYETKMKCTETPSIKKVVNVIPHNSCADERVLVPSYPDCRVDPESCFTCEEDSSQICRLGARIETKPEDTGRTREINVFQCCQVDDQNQPLRDTCVGVDA